MSYNMDGFNERSIYIHNSNDMNKLARNGSSRIDNSFAKMKVEENRANVETSQKNYSDSIEEPRGNVDNFILRTKNMRNVQNRLFNNNMFRK